MSERHASSDAAQTTRSALARRVSVLLPLPLGGAYDYRLPEGMTLAPGDFVVVPLGSREVIGVAWDAELGDVADGKLKAIGEKLDAPPLSAELRRFVEWVAQYTVTPLGAVLRMAMSVPEALKPPRPTVAWAISDAGHAALKDPDARELTSTRRRVLQAARDAPPMPAKELARLAGCGAGVLAGLDRLGWLERVSVAARLDREAPDWRQRGPLLSAEQAAAAGALVAAVKQHEFSVTL